MSNDKGLPERETGNWSGKQDKKPRPGEDKNTQAGQREYTEPSRKDGNSTGNAG
ncbi:MAG: hypothetical protein KF794_10510 [Xanthobacteraceae bacterium]|nr:hypothetical protein [Xanthobacteraceae bacterium]QYK44216.1 MAG: hypothetical protein KF794_10510 [Xanthobacteraceae bacterium]